MLLFVCIRLWADFKRMTHCPLACCCFVPRTSVLLPFAMVIIISTIEDIWRLFYYIFSLFSLHYIHQGADFQSFFLLHFFIFKGINVKTDIEALKVEVPNIVVGTPGRVMDLATSRKVLDLSKVKHFVLDECDRMLAEVSMRKDVQQIFKATPHEKQVMMFSATLDKEVRGICKKFCQDVSSTFLLKIFTCWSSAFLF